LLLSLSQHLHQPISQRLQYQHPVKGRFLAMCYSTVQQPSKFHPI